MSSFAPGDLVVCISLESPCCGSGGCPAGLEAIQPRLRQTYRVSSVGSGVCANCDTELLAFAPAGYEEADWCWPQLSFRKIEPASTNIFDLAKRKEPVDA